MSRTLFVVQRTEWWLEMWSERVKTPYLLRMDGDSLYHHLGHRADFQTTPSRLLATRADAEAECRRLTQLARPFFNPFWSTLGDRHSRHSNAFWDALFDYRVWDALTPDFGAELSEWCLWWEMCAPLWTDAQRHALWDAFVIELYHVAEVEFAE